MASLYREFVVDASPQFVWEAIRDVGAVPTRLARGFVTGTTLAGDTRTVTFANGFVVQEQIVSASDELRRLVYRAVGGTLTHHNAFFQVLAAPDGKTKLVWVTDLLPDEMQEPIGHMVGLGMQAIQKTLEADFRVSER